MKAIKNIWKIICYPLLYLGAQIVVSVFYAVAAAVAIGVQIAMENAASGKKVDAENIGEIIFSEIDLKIPMIISIFAAFLVMFLILRKEWKAERLWNLKNIGPAFVFCLSLGFAMNILTNCVLSFLPIREYSSPIDDIVGSNLVFDFLVFALFAPILEEIIFRGVVQRRLAKMVNLHFAIILQAFLFGLIHMNFIQGMYAFVLGIIIGYIYHWHDSIWFAFAIHISFNATSILLLYALGETEVNLFYFLMVSLGFIAISMASLRVFAKNAKIASKTASGINRWYY
ncbi:MAG: CPBP family intramembrane metalloprotease [Oscillospiraceae bacterium]|nr:CPBP family intramembrane metalloprotease [Oscillospiraceae bacterium]